MQSFWWIESIFDVQQEYRTSSRINRSWKIYSGTIISNFSMVMRSLNKKMIWQQYEQSNFLSLNYQVQKLCVYNIPKISTSIREENPRMTHRSCTNPGTFCLYFSLSIISKTQTYNKVPAANPCVWLMEYLKSLAVSFLGIIPTPNMT